MPSMTVHTVYLFNYFITYNRSECVGFVGQDQLKASLEGMEIVVIPAGVPRKPGMTRDDLFNTNAGKFFKHLVFSNFSCIFLNPNYFFKFELQFF